MDKTQDLKGRQFGYLTVVRCVNKSKGSLKWLCRCKCGNEVVVSTGELLNKRVASCGCRHKNKESSHNYEFAKRAEREWTRYWGKYEKPFEFNIAVTELHYDR